MTRHLIFLLFIGFSLIAHAQDMAHPNPEANMSPEEVAEMRTERMSTGLELTSIQKSNVYNLNLKYAKKRQNVLKSQFMTREEKRTEKRKLGENYNSELKTIVNDEQYRKYTQFIQDKKKGKTAPSR